MDLKKTGFFSQNKIICFKEPGTKITIKEGDIKTQTLLNLQ